MFYTNSITNKRDTATKKKKKKILPPKKLIFKMRMTSDVKREIYTFYDKTEKNQIFNGKKEAKEEFQLGDIHFFCLE